MRLLLILLLLLAPFAAGAQTAPPIRLVVPFAAGGSVDVLARLVAGPMAETLRQPVVVENRTGAGGLIATEHVVQSPADGTALLVASGGQVTIPAAFTPSLPFDPMRDLVPVTHLADVPYIFAVGPALPQPGLPEIIAAARAQPGSVTYASPGTGSVTHLMMEMLGQRVAARFEHVPYRGTAQATADLVAGRVGMTLSSIAGVKAQLDRGEMRAVATTAPARLRQFPNAPTTGELGIPDMDVRVWIGVVARAGTPPATLDRLDRALRAALATPEVQARMEALGMESVGESAQRFRETLATDLRRWRQLAAAGITIQ
jgi:tripartite-type tricarboxylate transporter receptor subunit TctC